MTQTTTETTSNATPEVEAEPPPFPPDDYAERMAWMQDPELEVGVDPAALSGKVITVAGRKGGIGKTTMATELSYLLGGILLDFEWDDGSAAVALGYRRKNYATSPLIEALEKDRTPRVTKGGPWRPDLVPGDKEFEALQPTSERTADLIERWAEDWRITRGGPVIIDSHPGGSPSSIGAMDIADVIVAPVVMADKEMNALEGMLEEHADAPLLLVPYKTKPSPPDRYIQWLKRLAKDFQVPVTSVVHNHVWVPERSRRMALCAVGNGRTVPKRAQGLVHEFHKVARRVAQYVA
jgi:chromosome partitioning protein